MLTHCMSCFSLIELLLQINTSLRRTWILVSFFKENSNNTFILKRTATILLNYQRNFTFINLFESYNNTEMRWYYLYLIDKNAEPQKMRAICSVSHRLWVLELRLKPKSPASSKVVSPPKINVCRTWACWQHQEIHETNVKFISTDTTGHKAWMN